MIGAVALTRFSGKYSQQSSRIRSMFSAARGSRLSGSNRKTASIRQSTNPKASRSRRHPP